MQGPIVKKILDLLGQDTRLIPVSSLYPEQIISALQRFTNTGQQFLLSQADVWRYGNNGLLLDYFDQHKHQKFFIQTVGHHYVRRLENVWEFPIPWMHQPKNVNFEHVPEHRPYAFSSLNYRPALHRILLGYNLWLNELLPSMIFTHGAFSTLSGYPQQIIESLPNFDQFAKLLPIQWQEPLIDFSNNGTTYELVHDAYCLSYANIATETETEFFGHDQQYATPTVTEKTFKCMIAGQLPIFLAAPGHLHFLEQLGLDVFYDLVGNDYDHFDTFDKIKRIIDICRSPTLVEDLYFRSVDRRCHNYNMIMSGQLENNILSNMLQFIEL